MNQYLDDYILIQQLSEGNSTAFEELFHKYFQYLHNVAYNRLQSREAADDIAQEVFADLWKNRTSLKIHTSFRAWLHQSVKHKVFKFIRHQSVRGKEAYIHRIYTDYYQQNPFPLADKMMQDKDLQNLVDQFLLDLPEKSRVIYSMSRDQNVAHNEIAEQLNCSAKTVEYHIGKVLQHLRVNLKDYLAILLPLCLLLAL